MDDGMAFWVHDGGVVPESGTQVIRAADYAAFVEAEDVLAQARARAAEIVLQAERELEEKRRQGYEDGVAEGKAEVAERFFDTVSASVEHLSGMESALIELVMRSLKAILGAFDNKELVAETVGHALRLVRDEKRVTLRVAVDDAGVVEERLADFARRDPGMGRIDVVPDAALSSGGCVMETEIGVIDATLERQLAIIENSFRKQLEEKRG